MIALASLKNPQRRTSRSSGVLVLDPPRHSDLPISILSQGKHLIGTSRDCRILIEAEGVQPRHAMILVGDQKILLKALDSRTWVNDSPVTEVGLRPGDRISVGPITFQVRFATADELTDYHPSPAEDELDADSGNTDQDRTFAIDKPSSAELIHANPVADEHPAVTETIRQQTINLANDVVASIDPIVIPPAIEVPPIPTPSMLAASTNEIVESARAVETSSVKEAATSASLEPHFLDIQKQIAALNEQAHHFNVVPTVARASVDQQRLAAREEELKQLAAELSRQSVRLRDRSTQISEREAELDRKQTQLALDNERLVKAAQTTRQELADEYARQMTLWQEWDAAYQRTTADLKTQLETVEQRRASIQAENERLAGERAEIQRLQSEHEDQRRAIAADRVQAAKELGDLHSQRAAFETERRQQLTDLQEREAQVASERRALAVLQDELLAVRQQIEHDRTMFATERSSESLRREQEVREHTAARTRLNEEQSSLQAIRFDLDSHRRSLEEQRELLKRERDEFEASRSEIDTLRTQLDQARIELELAKQYDQEKQAQLEAAERAAHRRQLDLEHLQQTLEAQQVQLESVRNSIRLEQDAIATARAELVKSTETSRSNLPGSLTDADNHHVHRREDWPAIPDAVEELLGIYGVKPSQSPTPTHAEPRSNSGFNLDLNSTSIESLAPVPPPIPKSDWSLEGSGGLSSIHRTESSMLTDQTEHGVLTGIVDPDSGSQLNSTLETAPVEQEVSWTSAEESLAGSEQESLATSSTATAELPLPLIDKTLFDINQQYGFTATSHVVDVEGVNTESQVLPIGMSLIESPTDVAQPDSDRPADENAFNSSAEVPTSSSAENTLENLRAQLAQLFDLKPEEQAHESESIESNVAQADVDQEPQLANDVGMVDPNVDSNSQIESNESRSVESVLEILPDEHAVESIQIRPESTPVDETVVVAGNEEPAEEETPWTRRLRELSAVADSASQKPAAPQPKPVVEASESANDSNDEDEFSVEAQLARLLGKPLNAGASKKNSASPVESIRLHQEPSQSNDESDAKSTASATTTDRSHLQEEPRHKQNKNAIREEVQSFRAVAQMSARKALAKHSWNNLKSDFYFASGLTTISTIATAWYVGAFFYGSESDPWKGVTCAVATFLSGHRLMRAASQLKLLRLSNSLPPVSKRDTIVSTTEESSPAVDTEEESIESTDD